jgi:Dolichyl-phosphate-mannose-protein mannosyltransferase
MLAAAWARRWAALALATVVAAAASIVDAQPVRSPWWTYADADASYTAAALNQLVGGRNRFVDHPGIPLTELTAVAFGIDGLARTGSLSADARRTYVDDTLLHLDSARPIFRGLAIAFYLAGALLAFLLFARLFGHWTWGFAAGILWVAAPGLVAMSIQLRPDVPLAVLTLVFAYAVGRGLQTRDPLPYVGAAVLTGIAVMTKLHALGLLAPLVVAAVWRPSDDGWRSIAARARERRTVLLAVLVLSLAVAIFLNVVRAPFTPTSEQTVALLGVLAGAAAAVGLGAAWSRLRALSVIGPAFAAGLLLAVAFDIPDGLQALVIVAKTVLGQGGVQEGVDSFAIPFSELPSIVGPRVTVVFLLALAAGVLGLVRRDPLPVVWTLGAAVMIVLAFVRPPALHYFAPGFVLCIPAVLWLLRSRDGRQASWLVWPVVALIAWPAFRDREGPTIETERFAALVEPTKRVVDQRLGPNEIALVPGNWPFADGRYWGLAERFVDSPPPYPYKYLPAIVGARPYAELRGWTPRYFISPVAQQVVGTQTIDVEQYGRYSVRRLPGTDLGLELLAPVP